MDIGKNNRTEIRRDEIYPENLVYDIFDQHSFTDHSPPICKHVEIKQECPFCAEKYRVSIVLNNLLSNTIRYALS